MLPHTLVAKGLVLRADAAAALQYNAGVLKTFDEIIVNAVDRQAPSS